MTFSGSSRGTVRGFVGSNRGFAIRKIHQIARCTLAIYSRPGSELGSGVVSGRIAGVWPMVSKVCYISV